MAETVTISRCPICSRRHLYNLDVTRDIVVGLQTGAPHVQRSVDRRFTRIFTCLSRGGEFEATVTLSESFNEPIREVSEPTPVDEQP